MRFDVLKSPLKDHIITIISVIQGTIDTTDGGGGSTGLLRDLKIGLMAFQHCSHLKSLGEGEELVYRTQILKETIALFSALQTENCIKQRVNRFRLNFFVHSITSHYRLFNFAVVQF